MSKPIGRVTRFTSTAALHIDEPIESFLSLASIDSLKSLLPDSLGINENLVPFVGNLWVANLANGNGDTLDTDTTLAYYKQFENTKIDLEHDFETVVGHIVSVHLTSFDEDYANGEGSKILKEKDVKGTNKLFNVAIVGVLYKECAPSIIKKIVASNNPESDKYLECSLSWETKFSDFHILLGHSVANGTVVDDPERILELMPYLRGNKGRGSLKDGTPVNRLIIGEIAPMGAGITLNPAAKVAGIIVSDDTVDQYTTTMAKMKKNACGSCPDCGDNSSPETLVKDDMVTCGSCGKTSKVSKWKKDEDSMTTANREKIIFQLEEFLASVKTPLGQVNSSTEVLDKSLASLEKNENISENISHSENINVSDIDNKDINIKSMKLFTSLAELESLNDETAKGYSFANFNAVLQTEIKRINDEWTAKVQAREAAEQTAIANANAIQKTADESKASVEKLQKEINDLKSLFASQEADQKFQERMNSLNDTYELSDEWSSIIATKIRGINDADFEAYEKELKVTAAHINKEVIKASKDKGEKKESKEIIKAALDNAVINEPPVPNTPAADVDKKATLRASFAKVLVK